MSVLDKVKGDPVLETTLTVKISKEQKRELIKFAKKHKISLGKMVRFGLDLVKEEIEKETE